MRILLTSPAGLGHIHPMVPLARALVGRGHDLLWAAPEDGVVHVEAAGLRAVAVAPPGLTQPAEVRGRFPELNDLPADEVPNLLFGKMFGAIATPSMLAGLTPVVRDWPPDLVVADAAEFAGHIAAAELGVPSVTKGFGPLLPERRVSAAGQEVAPLWRSRGLDPPPYGGSYEHLYLDIYPPALQARPPADHVPRRQPLRPVTDDGRVETSSPLPVPDSRSGSPLVYVTMGTVFNSPEPFHVVLAALQGLDARVLMTVGPRADPAAFGAQASHIRIERYVPQTAVLPHSDVVVSHGGSGTVLGTLALGRPQLCLPQGADQFLNAAAVTSAGAGISMMPDEFTAASVRDAVVRLLDGGSFRDAAGRIGASIATMPSPDEVAEMLENLT